MSRRRLQNAVNRLLASPRLAARIGQAARQLAVERYSWSGAAQVARGLLPQDLGAAGEGTVVGQTFHAARS